MTRLFSYDGIVIRKLEKIFDLMLLHLLWVVSSIPIISIGASTTALMSLSMKEVRGEGGYIFKNYIKEFRSNFKKSSAIWIIYSFVIAWFVFFINLSLRLGTDFSKILALIEMSLMFMVIGSLQYVFAVEARFENSIFATIKNSVYLSLRHFPYTVVMIAVIAFPVLIGAYVTELSGVMIFICFFCGSSLIANAEARILVKIFRKYEE